MAAKLEREAITLRLSVKPGDLVKYVGEGWPRNGTLGIVLYRSDVARYPDSDQTYSVKVHWAAKTGGESCWENPRSLEPTVTKEIYFK